MDETVTVLSEMFWRQKVDAETLDSLKATLTELVNNCYHHARPEMDICGLACAQA